MVFALAGDSTMTSDCDPAGAGGSSSSCTSVATCRPRFLRAAPVALRAELRDVPDFLEAIFPLAVGYRAAAISEFSCEASIWCTRRHRPEDALLSKPFRSSITDSNRRVADSSLVNRLVIAARRLIVVPRTFQERPQIVESDATIDLREGALDDVLEIRGTQRTAAIQREQVAPRFRRKPTALVRTENPEVHQISDVVCSKATET